MSRAFVKDDANQEPVFIPPRAPLPEGVANYVTPRGLRLLREELAGLEAERAKVDADRRDPDARKRRLAEIAGQHAQLAARIAGARVVDPKKQNPDEVRFGATVTLRTVPDGEERRVQIVGVDEAEAGEGRVAFTAPVARAVVGRTVGDRARLRTPQGEEELEIVAISYQSA